MTFPFDDDNPYASQPVGEPPPSKPPIYRRTWVQVAGASVVAFVVGIGAGGASGQQVAEEAEGRVTAALEQRDEAQTELAEGQAEAKREVEQARRDAAAELADDKAAVDKAKADNDAAAKKRTDELNARAAQLDQREAAVSGMEAEARANEFPGSGIFRVGEDIQPGTYKSDGLGGCYFARLSSLTAEGVDGIITNDNVSGPFVVQIRSSDEGFEANGCDTFRKVG